MRATQTRGPCQLLLVFYKKSFFIGYLSCSFLEIFQWQWRLFNNTFSVLFLFLFDRRFFFPIHKCSTHSRFITSYLQFSDYSLNEYCRNKHYYWWCCICNRFCQVRWFSDFNKFLDFYFCSMTVELPKACFHFVHIFFSLARLIRFLPFPNKLTCVLVEQIWTFPSC